jgi:hypothetical protein
MDKAGEVVCSAFLGLDSFTPSLKLPPYRNIELRYTNTKASLPGMANWL